MSLIDGYVGKRFGKLVILGEGDKFHQPSGQFQRGVLCQCDCGNRKNIRLVHIKSGRVSSCNCLSHADTGSKLHNTWRGMRTRCSKNHSESKYYYDKGIFVCDEWKTYLHFKKWAILNGYKEGLTIDRIDSNKGYNPSNCRFVTSQINTLNRDCTIKVNYKGQKHYLRLLHKKEGSLISYETVRDRIKRGWSVEDALFKKLRKIKGINC
jgi:hypothetical protein